MSWWSPDPAASPLATKGRSYDLNTGQIESTEETYVNRMQIKKQSSTAQTHNDSEVTPLTVTTTLNDVDPTTKPSEQEPGK